MLLEVVNKSKSISEVITHFGLEQSIINKQRMRNRIIRFNIDISHYPIDDKISSKQAKEQLKKNKWCKYTKDVLEEVVKESTSFRQVILKLGLRLSGGNQAHITRRIRNEKIDTSHFLKPTANLCPRPKKLWNEILILKESGGRSHAEMLRRALLESGLPYTCSKCGQDGMCNNTKLILEIHHIDGNWLDNRKENLEFICPNCHSQIPTCKK